MLKLATDDKIEPRARIEAASTWRELQTLKRVIDGKPAGKLAAGDRGNGKLVLSLPEVAQAPPLDEVHKVRPVDGSQPAATVG